MDLLTHPAALRFYAGMSSQHPEYGPLAGLIGVWEGSKGDDIAPSDDRGIENNKFRERMSFEIIKPVDNHEQILYAVRYATTAWRIGEAEAFHEETGYWMWDAAEKQVIRSFIVPRGITVLAGGTASPGDKAFKLSAVAGSDTYGICSNLFLNREFKTMRFDLHVKILGPDSFEYEEDTVIQMKGRPELFHHTDKNSLTRVS